MDKLIEPKPFILLVKNVILTLFTGCNHIKIGE